MNRDEPCPRWCPETAETPPSETPRRPQRQLEWFLAIYTLAMGVWVCGPADAMATPAFDNLLLLFSETAWGALFAGAGLCNVVALIINGGQGWTPIARAAVSLAVCWMFLDFALGFADTVPNSTAVFNYLALAAAHGWCAVAAMRDVARNRWAGHVQ